jgi:hypothetical protein
MSLIICVGMYRSGSTWQYEVVSHLVETYRDGKRLGFIEGQYFECYPEAACPSDRKRVLKAHDVHPTFVRLIEERQATPVYSYRDLRDVAFSYMYKAKLEFGDLLEQGFFAKVLENDAYWRSRRGVISQRYEQMMSDPTRAVADLAGWLGILLPAGEAHRLAEEYSWEANLRRTQEVRRKAAEAGIDLNDPEHKFEHDHQTLLHWNHLREGDRRGWRELATPEQREAFATHCGDWLIANGYETDTSWVTGDSRTLRADQPQTARRPRRPSRILARFATFLTPSRG